MWNSNQNEHVYAMRWQTEADDVQYDWQANSSMTDLPNISRIKEVIFEFIKDKYTGWPHDHYTMNNNTVYWTDIEDMKIIFNEYFKNDYKRFQGRKQLSSQELKRVTYKQDSHGRVICPCRTLHSIMSDGLIDLKKVVEEMIDESTITYNIALQKCYRIFNTRDICNTICSKFVTAGKQSTDAAFEYSRPTCHHELLTWIIEPMREDIFKLLKESKLIIQEYSKRHNRRLYEDTLIDQDISTINENSEMILDDEEIKIDLGNQSVVNTTVICHDNINVVIAEVINVTTDIVTDVSIEDVTDVAHETVTDVVTVTVTDVVTDVVTAIVTDIVTAVVTDSVTDVVTDHVNPSIKDANESTTNEYNVHSEYINLTDSREMDTSRSKVVECNQHVIDCVTDCKTYKVDVIYKTTNGYNR